MAKKYKENRNPDQMNRNRKRGAGHSKPIARPKQLNRTTLTKKRLKNSFRNQMESSGSGANIRTSEAGNEVARDHSLLGKERDVLEFMAQTSTAASTEGSGEITRED